MTLSVLILSDEPEFARVVLDRWQRERTAPAFTVMAQAAWQPNAERQPSMAVVNGTFESCQNVLQTLEQSHVPAVFLANDGVDVTAARQRFQKTAVLKRSDEWLESLVMLAREILRRTAISEHTADAERRAKEAERHAVLGRYMLEMRHTLNNALTSVLGNAELLLMEPGTLTGEAREQVSTIHNMSLRIHEILQRFSSIDAEMKFAESDVENSKPAAWQSAASGK